MNLLGRQYTTATGVEQSRSRVSVARSRSSELTLTDVLVGLVVMSITVLVIFQTYVAFQSFQRQEGESADSFGAGAFALSVLAIQAANAGAGIASSGHWFESCPTDPNIASSLRPITVLISDSGSVERPDSLVIRQSFAPRSVATAFAAPAAPGSMFRVQSTGGFSSGDRVVAISRTGACITTNITGVANSEPGVLDLMHASVGVALPATSVLVNLGPANRPSTARYDIVGDVLRSTDIGNGDSPNPLVSNIVNLKLQYGVDSEGDGVLDTWVSATGPWSTSALLVAPKSMLDKIVAIRIGLLVRTERRDRTRTGPYRWVLFDCEREDKSTCPGRLESTISGSLSGGYRYRTFETIVPLRNTLWNRGA